MLINNRWFEFYRVLPSFTGFLSRFTSHYLISRQKNGLVVLYRVLPSFYRVLLWHIQVHRRSLPSFTGFSID